MNELWREIPGFEGQYEVSDRGGIRSLDRVVTTRRGPRRHRGGVLSPGQNTQGYFHVRIGSKTRTVHQLVLAAFVGPKPPGMLTRHLNGINTDNRLENLVYGTYSENGKDTSLHGSDPQANKTHCPYGHAYAGENLLIRTSEGGKRRCRTCKRAKDRRLYAKAKAGQSAAQLQGGAS